MCATYAVLKYKSKYKMVGVLPRKMFSEWVFDRYCFLRREGTSLKTLDLAFHITTVHLIFIQIVFYQRGW